jgi:triosephosphate isomerase
VLLSHFHLINTKTNNHIKMAPIPASAQRERRLVGTSLKMYFDLPSTAAYISSVASLSSTADAANLDLFVIPDFVSLVDAKSRLANTNIQLGAQDSYSEDKGAYTGEVSPLTLSQAGVKIVEIGHAERRRLFGETDEDVAKKAEAVVKNGMVPLVCIGEKTKGNVASAAVGLAVRECEPQIKAALSRLPDDAEVILAYEPVWAIGASEPAVADHVVAVTQNLRALVAGRKGRTRILYGGSAGPGTFKKLKDGVDGLFLGRFAHDVKNLEKVIQEMTEP